jgi:hypothetical protein
VRRLVQLLSLLTLATSGVMIVGSFSSAEASGAGSAQPTVLQTAWFWKNAYATVNPPVGEAPPSASEPSGVPAGDLAVAHTSPDASSSKMSVVGFDLGAAAAAGTTINEFTVALTLDSDPQAANAGTPTIVACLPTRLWAAADGGDYTDEPPVDCGQRAKPKVDGSTYTFDITAIAQNWVDDQNIGVAFVNDPDNTQTPYQAVFSGAKTIKASMTYTAPLPTTDTSGGGGNSGSSSGGVVPPTTSGTTSSPGSPPAPVVDPPALADASSVVSDLGQTPQVAAPQQDVVPVAHVAPASSAPNRGFWIAAAAFALLILLASLVLGDDVTSPTATTSRLDRVLRGRTGEGSALSARS